MRKVPLSDEPRATRTTRTRPEDEANLSDGFSGKVDARARRSSGEVGAFSSAALVEVLAPQAGRAARGFGPVALQRAPDPKKVAAASDQAAASALLAWGLRGIQFLIAVLGLKGHLSGPLGFPVGVDTKGQPIRAYLVPGQIEDVAMVVAGVHGSEQSGVEVADRLLSQLAAHRPYYTVVVVPRLFPDNVAGRAAWEKDLATKQGKIALAEYRKLRNKAGDPGRITKGGSEPNRQFPDLGKDLDLAKPVDSKNQVIEPSNLALMALISAFKPSRILSIHAIKNVKEAGIYSDPHPSVAGKAQAPMAKAADDLALDMAKKAKALGANVPGNERTGGWTSLYPGQDPKLSAEQIEKENKKGRSFGQWGPSRGITVITLEVGEQYGSDSAVTDPNRAAELEGHASAVREVFLGPPPVGAGTVPGAGAVPAQRLVIAHVAENAGNRAASLAVQTIGQRAVQDQGQPVAQRFLGGLWEDISDAVGAIAGTVTGVATVPGKTLTGVIGGLSDISYGMPAERAFVKRMVLAGMADADALTQMVYALRYPETALRKLDPKDPADKARIKEWMRLKKDLVDPSVERYRAAKEFSAAEIERRVKRATRQAKSGGASGARTQIAADIKATAKVSVEDWFAAHVPNATFLGLPIRPSAGSAVGGVHQHLADKLATAEGNLQSMPELRGLAGVDLADAVGLQGLGGLRPPKLATGGERPSLHCYGLAVDINYSGNPFVGLNSAAVPKMIERATLLMRGTGFKITAPPPEDRSVMEQWLLINSASEDVITYLNMDQPTIEYMVGELVKSAGGLPSSMKKVSWWIEKQKADRALKGQGDLVGRDPRKSGIMDLDERLVQALTDAGLTWGGMYNRAKDLMHFDDRSLFRKSS